MANILLQSAIKGLLEKGVVLWLYSEASITVNYNRQRAPVVTEDRRLVSASGLLMGPKQSAERWDRQSESVHIWIVMEILDKGQSEGALERERERWTLSFGSCNFSEWEETDGKDQRGERDSKEEGRLPIFSSVFILWDLYVTFLIAVPCAGSRQTKQWGSHAPIGWLLSERVWTLTTEDDWFVRLCVCVCVFG